MTQPPRHSFFSKPPAFVCSVGLFVLLCLWGILTRAPVTWNEIFFIASLKKLPDTAALTSGLAEKFLHDNKIILSQALHNPPWLLSSTTWLAHQLNHLCQEQCFALIGQAELLAERMSCVIIAILIGIIWSALRKRDELFGNPFQPRLVQRAKPEHIVLFLFVLCRSGALEQLFFVLAVLLLGFLPNQQTKLNSDHRRAFFAMLGAGIALILSGTRTWIPALFIASFVACLRAEKNKSFWRWFLSLSLLVAAGYSVAFIYQTSYQAFVHHLNQRWFNRIGLASIRSGWAGSSLLWRVIALGFALTALRHFAQQVKHATHAGSSRAIQLAESYQREPFFVFLTASAGFWIAIRQSTPLFEDLCLLAAVFFLAPKRYCPAGFSNAEHATEKIFAKQNLTRFFATWTWRLYTLACAGVIVFAALLIISPATEILPELKSWLSALKEFILARWLDILTFVAATGILLFANRYLSRGKSEQTQTTQILPAISRLSIFLFALFIGVSEIRARILWEHLKLTVDRVAAETTLLYLPPMDPFLQLSGYTKNKNMVVVDRTLNETRPQGRTFALLLPTHVSEVCQAMHWKIEANHGIFTLCSMNQDSLWKLLPLN